jgi:hypothetical protein
VSFPRLAILAGGFPGPVCGELEAVHERHTTSQAVGQR